MPYLIAWFVTLIVFAGADLTWIGLFAGALFKAELGGLLRETPRIVPGLAFYLVYAAGLVVLAVAPAMAARSAAAAVWRGAVLGLVSFATFDLTNLAILQGWSVKVSLFDMAWGTFASAVAAAAGYAVATRARSSAPPHAP